VGPNQVISASENPAYVLSPAHATWPSGRISTAEGGAISPNTGSSHTWTTVTKTGVKLPAGAHVLRLSFDTGERVDVAGDGLVGRSPSAEDGVAHVVPVDDPARSISKTHLAFGLDGATDRLWVMDRGSTNGTVLVAPDGTSSALPAGTRATVAAGWTIRFGQRSARVERR